MISTIIKKNRFGSLVFQCDWLRHHGLCPKKLAVARPTNASIRKNSTDRLSSLNFWQKFNTSSGFWRPNNAFLLRDVSLLRRVANSAINKLFYIGSPYCFSFYFANHVQILQTYWFPSFWFIKICVHLTYTLKSQSISHSRALFPLKSTKFTAHLRWMWIPFTCCSNEFSSSTVFRLRSSEVVHAFDLFSIAHTHFILWFYE